MSFKSNAQRRKFHALVARGEMSPETLQEWESATPKGKKLPERLHKKAFVQALEKTAVIGEAIKDIAGKMKKVKPETWDKAGLGLLAMAPAAHIYKSVKEKDPGQAALGATELGGLGLLYHAVRKAHPV